MHVHLPNPSPRGSDIQEPSRRCRLHRQQSRAARARLGAPGGADGGRAARSARARAVTRLRAARRPGETVSLFWPMRDEIDPRGLIDDVLASGRQCRHAGGREAAHVLPRASMARACLEAGVFGTQPSACRPADGRSRFHRRAARRLRPARRPHRLRRRPLRRGDRRPLARGKAVPPRGHRLRLPGGGARAGRAARHAPAADRDGARADRRAEAVA